VKVGGESSCRAGAELVPDFPHMDFAEELNTQAGLRYDSQFLHTVPNNKPRSILIIRLPPPRLRRFISSSSGWRLRGESDPAGRHDLLSVSTRLMIEHQLLHSSTDDSKPELGRRFPSHPRLPRGTPGDFSVAFSQPCPLLIHHRDQLDHSFRALLVPLLVDSRRLFHTHDLLLSHLRPRRHFAGLQVLPERDQQLASQGHDSHLP
jgi:hypothetical protein